MSQGLSSNSTIAKNTLYTYLRLFINLFISLYTSRVILEVLGVDDLGIYQVVGGGIAIFIFIGSATAGANSRFLAYELPRNDMPKLKETFSILLTANVLLMIVFFVAAEVIGHVVIFQVLSIPPEREFAALCVYQISVISSCFTMLQSPFAAALIAHEEMAKFAYIGILDSVLKLAICYLVGVVPFDPLIVYASLILASGLIIQFIYYAYCRRNFEECVLRLTTRWEAVKPILTFSGWEMFSNFCFGFRQQGYNMLINVFFTVAVNAAVGFSNNIYGAVRGFANNFMLAVRPVITKSYSVGEFDRLNQLILFSGKLSFALMLLLSLPFLLEGEYIITLWLKNPPVWTVEFCKLQLLIALVSVIYNPIYYGIVATGKNRLYSIIESGLVIISLPLVYLFFHLGYSPLTLFVILLVIEMVKDNVYLFVLKRYLPTFDIYDFFKRCILPSMVLFAIAFAIGIIPSLAMPESSFVRLLAGLSLGSVSVAVYAYLFMLPPSIKATVHKFVGC